MPYINLKLVGKLTKQQKEEIARQFSHTLLKVAEKPLDHTYIVIDEVSSENWAVGGSLMASKIFTEGKSTTAKSKN